MPTCTATGRHEFHTAHITHLAAALQRELLPLGYSVGIESSLQIRRDDTWLGEPKSDVTLFDAQGGRPAPTPMQAFDATAGAMVTPIAETLEIIEDYAEYRALAIYKQGESGRGEAVAWLESPSCSRYLAPGVKRCPLR